VTRAVAYALNHPIIPQLRAVRVIIPTIHEKEPDPRLELDSEKEPKIPNPDNQNR
jgi:hypothetical protein